MFTESVSVSDDETISTSLGKSDSASITEQLDYAFSKPESDSVSLSEAESKQINKALDESVSITESLVLSKGQRPLPFKRRCHQCRTDQQLGNVK